MDSLLYALCQFDTVADGDLILSYNLETLKGVASNYHNQCYITTTMNNYLQL